MKIKKKYCKRKQKINIEEYLMKKKTYKNKKIIWKKQIS